MNKTQTVEERFDKKFTRKDRGDETNSKYRRNWFVKEGVIAQKLLDFVQSEIKANNDRVVKIVEGMEDITIAEFGPSSISRLDLLENINNLLKELK